MLEKDLIEKKFSKCKNKEVWEEIKKSFTMDVNKKFFGYVLTFRMKNSFSNKNFPVLFTYDMHKFLCDNDFNLHVIEFPTSQIFKYRFNIVYISNSLALQKSFEDFK